MCFAIDLVYKFADCLAVWPTLWTLCLQSEYIAAAARCGSILWRSLAHVHPPTVPVRALETAAHLAAQSQPSGWPWCPRVHEGLGKVSLIIAFLEQLPLFIWHSFSFANFILLTSSECGIPSGNSVIIGLIACAARASNTACIVYEVLSEVAYKMDLSSTRTQNKTI